MHFTNAVLEESLRITGFVHANLPHHSSKPIECNGFTIPANCTIFGNLFHIMNDPEVWKEPYNFRPERFLDQDGTFHHNERVIPFALGKRYCMGQSFAEKELFLFFVGLIQKFKFVSPPDQKLQSYHPDCSFPKGALRKCPDFSVKLEHW